MRKHSKVGSSLLSATWDSNPRYSCQVLGVDGHAFSFVTQTIIRSTGKVICVLTQMMLSLSLKSGSEVHPGRLGPVLTSKHVHSCPPVRSPLVLMKESL